MIHVSIPLSPDLQHWIEARVSDGTYADTAEYFRDLAQRDRAASDRLQLKALIDEGLASGVIDRDIDDVIDDILAEDPDLRVKA